MDQTVAIHPSNTTKATTKMVDHIKQKFSSLFHIKKLHRNVTQNIAIGTKIHDDNLVIEGKTSKIMPASRPSSRKNYSRPSSAKSPEVYKSFKIRDSLYTAGMSDSTLITLHHSKEDYYIVCRNMNPELAKAIGMDPTDIAHAASSKKTTLPNGEDDREHKSPDSSDKSESMSPWIPPTQHGIEHTPRIIPEYYLKTNMNKYNVLVIDYYYMIQDDIRNLRPLNAYQLKYLKRVSENDKMTIIKEFNNVVAAYITNYPDN
jgi:hypothetical protein